MADVIRPLCPRDVVGPLLPSLPVAAMASQPAATVLPLLSPIMRQRVQFLSAANSSEPWIRLLCYDPAKAAKLIDVARSSRFEPHPVSGEIEVDWDNDAALHGSVEARFKRVDVETLQALVLVRDLDLEVHLVYCDGDAEGGGPGWRIGEVSVPDASALDAFGGHTTADEAERAFRAAADAVDVKQDDNDNDNSEDDDDYWAQYDATPAGRTPAAQTPAVKRSPAPSAMLRGQALPTKQQQQQDTETEEEDAYFRQYDSVQPAMDNHDPDEEAELVAQDPQLAQAAQEQAERPPLGFALGAGAAIQDDDGGVDHERLAKLVHPRPASFSASSVSSNGDRGGSSGGSGGSGSAVLVAKLEESAGRREQSEFGVKQHVSRSIKSLYMLARTAGIDRDEFEQLVKTELDMLTMMDD